MQPAQVPDARLADAILVAHAEADLEKGLARIRARIREAHGPIAGPAIEALVTGAVATLRLRARRRDDARFLLALAHRVEAGEDPRELARQHLDHVLRLDDKMGFLAKDDAPEFQPVKEMALDLFARRLPDLARMASVEGPEDYDDLVRRAFPGRAAVEAIVDDNMRTVAAMVEHLEQNPHVLHAPRSLTPKLAAMARDMLAWTSTEAKRGIEEIYADGR